MKTKEEILEKETLFNEYEGGITGIFNAMDEYAKQQSIAFNQYILGKLKVDKSTWAGQENDEYISHVHANPDKSYAQFIEQQSPNK